MRWFIFTFVICLSITGYVFAAEVGPNSSATESGTNWTNVTNVRVSDNNDASYNNTSEDRLRMTNFAFDRITGVVDSIILTVEGSGPSGDASQRGMDAQLVINGKAVGDVINFTLGTADETITIIGSTDGVWGTILPSPEISSIDFGVEIADDDASADALTIDLVQLRVVYTAGPSLFKTQDDSAGAWTKDADLREEVPTQIRGTLTTATYGSNGIGKRFHPIYQDTLVFQGDTTNDGDGIPAGQTIVACTLWVEIQSIVGMALNVTDVYDLYTLTQGWNEVDATNAVSWTNRIDNTAWTSAGGTRTKIVDDAIFIKKFHPDSVVWTLSGVLYDSIDIADGDSLPIPIPVSVAQDIYDGLVYGILMFRASGALTSFMPMQSSEKASKTTRPTFHWWYEVAASPPLLLPRRRRLRKIGI